MGSREKAQGLAGAGGQPGSEERRGRWDSLGSQLCLPDPRNKSAEWEGSAGSVRESG